MMDLVLLYRSRFDDELEQINLVQTVGNRPSQPRQHAAREAAIALAKEDETNQFQGSGIEIPDLINKKHLENFKKWDGDPKHIQNLKLKKITQLDLDKLESTIDEETIMPETDDEKP